MSSGDSSSASTSTTPISADIQQTGGPVDDVPSSDRPQVIPTPPSSATTPTTPGPTVEDRSTLLSKARSFLASPQIVHQDAQAKRTFLKEKGLDDVEVESLLREVPAPAQAMVVPPRSYPQGPPSNLPGLILGVLRLFSWIAGGSTVVVFIYYRYLLPKIVKTTQARAAIKSHQLGLLSRLTKSVETLKETRKESFASLPKLEPWKEPSLYSKCQTVTDVVALIGDVRGEKEKQDVDVLDVECVPPVTLLRCAIGDLTKGGQGENAEKPTTEDVFRYLEGKIPWLVTEAGFLYEERLWDALSDCPLFHKLEAEGESTNSVSRWEYHAPAPTPVPPVIQSLGELSDALPRQAPDHKSPFQHGLQTLSDFTGYISTQLYAPYRSPSASMGIPSLDPTTSSAEEEFKKEVKALKGLVLNRRSFMPTLPRPLVPTQRVP